MRGYMSGEKILVLLWIAAMFFWGKYAPLLTPYVRNLIGIVTVFVALCLFCAVFVIYWKLAVIIWGVIVGTFFLQRSFLKIRKSTFTGGKGSLSCRICLLLQAVC